MIPNYIYICMQALHHHLYYITSYYYINFQHKCLSPAIHPYIQTLHHVQDIIDCQSPLYC